MISFPGNKSSVASFGSAESPTLDLPAPSSTLTEVDASSCGGAVSVAFEASSCDLRLLVSGGF